MLNEVNNMDFKQDACPYTDALLQDLKTLCQIPSTMDMSTADKGQPFGEMPRAALDQMIAIGKRDGFITDNCDGYAGSIDIGEGDEVFGILGHLDVVPVNKTGWSYPPFDCTLDGDMLYGRGVADDKGPLLAAYYAAKIINKMDFEKKMNRVVKEISDVLSLPQPIVEERKYIVEVVGEVPDDSTESQITQCYLIGEANAEVRLRRRVWRARSAEGQVVSEKVVNVHTPRKRISDTEEIVTERQINNSLYEMMLALADPDRTPISKLRKSFIWKGQYFELDFYKGQLDGLIILETKGITAHENVKFPPFIRVVEDITCNKNYYNYNLAKKKE